MTAPDVNADVRARLLPCPFCGGIARMCIGYHAKYDVKVACDDCSSEGALYGDDDFKGDHAEEWKQNAIAAWNRRAAHADLAGEVRELVDKVRAVLPFVATEVLEHCNGNKCREPWCAGCCGEEEAEASMVKSNLAYQQLQAALAKFHPTKEKP